VTVRALRPAKIAHSPRPAKKLSKNTEPPAAVVTALAALRWELLTEADYLRMPSSFWAMMAR